MELKNVANYALRARHACLPNKKQVEEKAIVTINNLDVFLSIFQAK
jgi:hypothetical protein